MLMLDNETALSTTDIEDALSELPPILARHPLADDLMVVSSIHRVQFVAAGPRGNGSGSIYGITGSPDNYFVEEIHTPARNSQKAHLDIYLDTAVKIKGAPSTRWDRQPASGKPRVSDSGTLDSIESFILQDGEIEPDYAIFIHRSGEIFEVTPQGKIRLEQHPMSRVA